MSDINKEQLEVELTFAVNELQAENQKDAGRDTEKIARLEQKRDSITAQLDQINRAEKEQQIEEKVHSEITFAIPGVDFTKLPTELINVIQAVVKADRRKNLAEHAAELEQLDREAEEELTQYRDEVASLSKEVEEVRNLVADSVTDNASLTYENGKYRDSIAELLREKEDLTAKLANAARLIEEKDGEIERLKSEIDDYQKAKVLGERQSQAVIDVTPDEAEEINAAIKTFLKSEDWGSVIKAVKEDGSFELVKRDVFESEWTPITPPSLGGSDNAAETFQGEAAEVDATNGGVSAPEAPGVDFRNEEETANGRVAEYETIRSDDAPATYGELKALAARVAQLEFEKVAVA